MRSIWQHPRATIRRLSSNLSPAPGFTLLELLLVASLLGLLALAAVPRLSQAFNLFMLRRVHGTVMLQISQVREQAIAHERTSHILFSNGHWCAWFEGEIATDCNLAQGQAVAPIDVRGPSHANHTFTFSAGRGFSALSGNTLRIRARHPRQEMWVVVSALGRIRACAFPALEGVPECV